MFTVLKDIVRIKNLTPLVTKYGDEHKWSNFGVQEVAPLKQKRYVMSAAFFCKVLVVAGGLGENLYMLSVEFYQNAINKWMNLS